MTEKNYLDYLNDKFCKEKQKMYVIFDRFLEENDCFQIEQSIEELTVLAVKIYIAKEKAAEAATLDKILNNNNSTRTALLKAKGQPDLIDNILNQNLQSQQNSIELALATQRLTKKD